MATLESSSLKVDDVGPFHNVPFAPETRRLGRESNVSLGHNPLCATVPGLPCQSQCLENVYHTGGYIGSKCETFSITKS